MSKYKMKFAKGYTPNWTNEIFTVHRVQPTMTVTYLLKDHTDEFLAGGFCEYELSKTRVGDVYLVDKILQRKGDRVRVRWLGFNGKQRFVDTEKRFNIICTFTICVSSPLSDEGSTTNAQIKN